MKLPFTLSEPLDASAVRVWEKVFLPTKGRKYDKTIEESLWRRIQSEKNQQASGWKSSADMRRKIIYYKHEYDQIVNPDRSQHLALVKTFIFISLTLPFPEIKEYQKTLAAGISQAGWKSTSIKENRSLYQLEDLVLETVLYTHLSDNPQEYCAFPENYVNLELNIYSKGFVVTPEIRKIIWGVMKYGFRKSLPRNNPDYINDVSEIIKFLPCQMEMGCGASYEAGVLPLHSLHEIYSINEPFSKKFIMSAAEDTFFKGIISNPLTTLAKTSNFFLKTVTAPLTDFYKILKILHDQELVVGPIITNNFDGLHLREGLQEIFVRTYSETEVMPDIIFDPKAKSLMVVGCHADRRNVEQSARSKGLKIIYIDPEGWWVDGKFREYLLESPQQNDLIFRKGASEAFNELYKKLQSIKASQNS